MKISLKKVTVGQVAKGYKDDALEGCTGYDGLLNIRPPYQREFVYKEKQRNAVVDTVTKGFPLNVMNWLIVTGKQIGRAIRVTCRVHAKSMFIQAYDCVAQY